LASEIQKRLKMRMRLRLSRSKTCPT
jgi:hypothetical protein